MAKAKITRRLQTGADATSPQSADVSISSVDELFSVQPNEVVSGSRPKRGSKNDAYSLERQAAAAIRELSEAHTLKDVATALRAALTEAEKQSAEDATGDIFEAVRAPLPQLTPAQIEAVRVRGRERPWSSRDGYRMSPFEWVRDTYREWIPGLLQSHLKIADPALYAAFAKRVSREGGRPQWLDVPSEPEANLRNDTDPEMRAQRLAVRNYVRGRRRVARSTDPTQE